MKRKPSRPPPLLAFADFLAGVVRGAEIFPLACKLYLSPEPGAVDCLSDLLLEHGLITASKLDREDGIANAGMYDHCFNRTGVPPFAEPKPKKPRKPKKGLLDARWYEGDL